MSQGDNGDGHLSEGRKGRRELSTSKRAAQNRAAQVRDPANFCFPLLLTLSSQRAFRQRKEEYIKQLKDQVKEFENLCELYKTLQAENYQLRDYIINLQSRLLETQGEIPPAPAGVDLSRRPDGVIAQHPHQAQAQPQQQQSPQQQQLGGALENQHHNHNNNNSSNNNNGGLSERQIGELQMAAQAAAAAQHGTLRLPSCYWSSASN